MATRRRLQLASLAREQLLCSPSRANWSALTCRLLWGSGSVLSNLHVLVSSGDDDDECNHTALTSAVAMCMTHSKYVAMLDANKPSSNTCSRFVSKPCMTTYVELHAAYHDCLALCKVSERGQVSFA